MPDYHEILEAYREYVMRQEFESRSIKSKRLNEKDIEKVL